MLTDLREKSQSFLIYIMFGILILVFIFFFGPQAEGINPTQTVRNLSEWAADVRGEEISLREVEVSVRRQALYSRDFDGDANELQTLRRDAVGQIVEQVLLEQRGRNMGIAIGDKALSQFIVSEDNPDYPLFTDRDGNFDKKSYRDQLGQLLGATPEIYRRSKEREIIGKRYVGFLANQVKVSEQEIKAEFERGARNWNLEFMTFAPSRFEVEGEVLEGDALTAFVAKSKDSISGYYAKNKGQYVRARETKIRRVLIKKPKDAKPDELEAAKNKAEALLANAKIEGADFAAIATESSEGYYKANGGDMGWQGKSNTSAEDYAIYEKLKRGEVSPLQNTSIGFWFVQADDVKDAVNRSLEQSQSEIASQIWLETQQNNRARAVANTVLARAKAGETLTAIAQTQGEDAHPVSTTGEIRANRPAWEQIPTIGRSVKLASALDSLTDKKPTFGEILDVDGRLMVVRLKSRAEPEATKYTEEKDDIERRLRSKRVSQLFGNWEAILYGPTRQREIFKKFSGGALVAGLEADTNVRINDGAFAPLNTADAPAGAPASQPAN